MHFDTAGGGSILRWVRGLLFRHLSLSIRRGFELLGRFKNGKKSGLKPQSFDDEAATTGMMMMMMMVMVVVMVIVTVKPMVMLLVIMIVMMLVTIMMMSRRRIG